MRQAKFITLDGIDGAGKSTHIEYMKKWFAEQNIPTVFTREPGGTPVGESLRQILLEPKTQVSLDTEALMVFASRMQHLQDVIYPALAQGKWVISDRFTDATYAYQGGGRGLSSERIAILEQWVQQGFQPDLTFIFDVPLSVASERMADTRQKDRFEQEQSAFFERTRAGYLQRASSCLERYEVLDASSSKEAVQQQIEHILTQLKDKA